jgi:MFS family permease
MTDVKISRKQFLVASIIGVNSISWSYLTASLIIMITTASNIPNFEKNFVYVAYFVSLAAANLLGVTVSKKVKQLRFLQFWIILGGLTTLIPTVIQLSSIESLTVFSVILGFSVGIGLPSCLVYIVNMTEIEERGRVSGTILLVNYCIYPILAILTNSLYLKECCVLFSAWRFCGLAVHLLKPKEEPKMMEQIRERMQHFPTKAFIKYFVPWLLFCLADAITSPFLYVEIKNIWINSDLIILCLSSIFCLIGGVLLDFVGRKHVVIGTTIALGLGYATVGLFPSFQFAWLIFSIIYGASWGILTTVFMLVVWADLASTRMRKKVFAIGVLPPFVSNVVAQYLEPFISSFPIASTFSLVAFFLFSAVIPLFYAPETLPRSVIERRRMEKYINKAKKEKEKIK